ncbi:hypothetical protein MKW92_049100 [Papaver armeniacum]|nr:hypothetical protein MKW92_049100 [Papaver armeniacum]
MLLQLFSYFLLLSWLTLLKETASLEGPFFKAKTGCDAKCGNISIPYPFGMSQNGINVGCSFDGVGFDYSITCNTSFNPPKPFLGVGDTEFSPPSSLCYNASGGLTLDQSVSWMNLSRTSFTVSYTKNMYFTVGCNAFSLIQGPDLQNYTGTCKSSCETKESVMSGSCVTKNGCCENTIPKGLKRIIITISKRRHQSKVSWSFDPCNYAFIGQYTFQSSDILDGYNFVSKGKDVPVVLDWGIGNKTCEEAEKDLSTFACQANSYCINPDNNPGYLCICNEGYGGNPYLSPGCQDVNECDDQSSNLCVANCTNTIGSYICSCPEGSRGDGKKDGSGCAIQNSQNAPVLQISIGKTFYATNRT